MPIFFPALSDVDVNSLYSCITDIDYECENKVPAVAEVTAELAMGEL